MPAPLRFQLDFSNPDAHAREASASDALRALPESAHAERAHLHAVIAGARVISNPSAVGDAAEAAAREAELAGDRVSYAWALIARCATDLSPHSLDDRLARARELLEIAHETGEDALLPSTLFMLLGGLAEKGDMAGLDEQLNPTGRTLASFPAIAGGRHVAWFRCMRATLDGQADHAEQLANEAYAIATAQGDRDAEAVWVGQVAIVRWMQGRVVELEPAFLRSRQLFPGELIWAVSLAWVWLRQGRVSAARGLVASLDPIDEYPRDRNWLAAVTILAVVASELGERELAAGARERLLPFEDRLATIGLGVTCWGTVARPLALVARLLGDEDAALAHYRKAVEVSARIGAQAWLAEAQWELATILGERGGDANRAEAIALATEAATTGRMLQLHGVEDSASAVLASLVALEEDTPDDESPVLEKPRVRVLGRFEVIGLNGQTARWQSRKARDLLKILIARRGAPIERETLMDLLWPGEPAYTLGNRLSVAASTVRRALDPASARPSSHFLDTRGDVIRLHIDRIRVDVEDFLRAVKLALAGSTEPARRDELLARALVHYGGDAFVDDLDALWAERLSREVHAAHFAALHAVAASAHARDDQLSRMEAYRSILESDAYDQRAHEGLIDALSRMGSHGKAADARAEFAERMAELGLAVA